MDRIIGLAGGRDGRVSSLLQTINSTDSYTQTYVWNELGNLASQAYPTCNHCPVGTVPSRTVSYTYTQGFLTAVPNWATSITYHPNGLVNQVTHVNGVVSTQANDPNRMKRPASITVTKSTSTLFATGAYAYDGSGNVSKIGSDYYLYDTLGRLKEGTALQAGSSNRQTYGYDGFGNLTSTTSWVNGSGTTRTNAVVGSTNRLSAAGYDGAGNQTTWGTYAYTWDLMGSMKAYQGSGNDWAYAYDADDERMLVYNVVDGKSVFRIRGLDGKVLREVKLGGGVWSWGKDWIYRDGQLLATAAPGSVTRYAHADHLGSPRLFTDAAGIAKERFHYYPFGEQAGSAPTAPEALRFTGHERDSGASSGTADDLDYMHARYYHPQLGRFLSVDPINSADAKRPGSWNKYAYAGNSPVVMIDPDGRSFGLFTKGLKILVKGGDVASTLAGAASDVETLTASDSTLGERATAAFSLGTEVFSPVSVRDAKTGVTAGGKAVAKMAEKLVEKFGKGRVTARTAGGKRLDIDLQGKDHHSKQVGEKVPTPHVHESKMNVGPNGEINLSDKTVRPATKEDLRVAEKILEQER